MNGRGNKRRGGGHGGGEHENSERWLLTYADMITLLVAFFIMLYAMSVTNVTKFQQLAISVRSGFSGNAAGGGPGLMSGGVSAGTPTIMPNGTAAPSQSESQEKGSFPVSQRQHNVEKDNQNLDLVYDILKKYIAQHHLEQLMQVSRDERGVTVVVMTDHMLFNRGSSEMQPAEFDLMNKLAGVINIVPNKVRVEGYTDNLPIHNLEFPSNWELSAIRATTVLRYFVHHNVDPSRLEAAGCGEEDPIKPNDTEEHRALNRRVAVVILKRYSDT